MNRRILRTALSATTAAGLLTLAACGGSSGSSSQGSVNLKAPATKSGTLTMFTKFADVKQAPYFKQVVADYEKANPKVTIKLQQVGDQPYKDKIQVLTASRNLPDIFFSWAGDFANKFIRAGYAADLSSVIGPNTTVGKTLTPAALNAFKYQGKYYGLPIDLDAKYMVYNATAFKKAGITAAPATLADLLTDCGKLKTAGYTPLAFGNQYGWPAIHYITQLNAYDVPAATRDKDYNPATGSFTDPGYVQALTQFQQIISTCGTTGSNGLAHEAAQATVLNGKSAMQYVESLEFVNFTKGGGAPAAIANNWSFFKLPAAAGSKGDTGALTGAPDGFLVNAKSKEAPLAADFLKFFASKANASQMTKQIGWLSPVAGSATSSNSYPQLSQALDSIDHASNFAIWLDTVTNANVAQAYLSGVEGMLSGSKTPAQVMQGVQAAAAVAKKQS